MSRNRARLMLLSFYARRSARALPAGRQASTVRQAGVNRTDFMLFVVYVLKSEQDSSLYIGMTCDLERRLKEHNAGCTSSIRNKIPFVLLESHSCKDRMEARALEKELKKGYKREELRKKYDLWRSARAVNRTDC